MRVLAKTDSGFILTATASEVNNIARAMAGFTSDTDVGIGDELSASDFSSVIDKIRKITASYEYKEANRTIDKFNECLDDLRHTLATLGKIA